MNRSWCFGVVLATGLGIAGLDARAGTMTDRDRRCLAMIAYAEAASEGSLGMLAVMRVVHNRIRDRRFPDDACGVALQAGQFQPVGERPGLRAALHRPEQASMAEAVGATSREARLRLVQAWRLAAVAAGWPVRDPTRGALYFVNPRLMDPGRCPWFAQLKRSAAIGEHVFMTHYAPGERRGPRALDCAEAGKGRAPRKVARATG
jgi:spore germination cell wall hydrolase CwlJ-like protein